MKQTKKQNKEKFQINMGPSDLGNFRKQERTEAQTTHFLLLVPLTETSIKGPAYHQDKYSM
jgi:hypothetical protein